MTVAAEAGQPRQTLPVDQLNSKTYRGSGSIMMPGGQAAQNRSPQQPLDQPPQQPQPSKTVRRHPNAAEPTRAELLKYLACLEGELAARDAAIDSLRQQRQEQLLQQARNGRYGLADPYAALQRDSEINSTPGLVTSFGAFCESDIDEAALKSMYDSELAALENLIDMQSRAQQRMREQINQVERRYRRVCSELETERRKHEKDAAEGDDVLAGLEKERERLRCELEFERQQSRKLDREVARVSQALADERALSDRQRRVALSLIRDRRALTSRLSALQSRCQQLEREAAAAEAAAAAELEAAALANRVDAEQRRARDLAAEVERLRALLAAASHPASQPGGLLKVKPEPPVRRTPGPTVTAAAAAAAASSKQQQPAGAKSSTKHSQQQQQQQQQVCAVNGK
ncbi:hypothetical protein BOX15_Mlig009869g1 [Macrostomum lignano]|uniref:Cortactin-binding protein-2 N-terminal domain-containing protein n=2 Tax=Macrostomum lignano TaxID=282301 RepID=A0A267FA87_9PLAT|nr:hypothetical protein BOX15_Mlig009869g1 [Macrostomum lignano]